MPDTIGAVTIGALLGANQSFDDGALAQWSKLSDQASAYIVGSASAVHSSAYGLHAVTGSTGGTTRIVSCDLSAVDAAATLAWPGVGSHTVWSWVWVRAVDAPSSGQARWRLSGNSDAFGPPIAFGASLSRYDLATAADSPAAALSAGLDRVTAGGATAGVLVDDVLTQIDPIALHPEWTLEAQDTLLRAEHRTQSGRLGTVTWGRYGALTVPLRWLSDGEAGLLNWWWERQAPLAFTLNGSDAEAVAVCRITNPRQPVGRRIRPYGDRWSGSLTLETLDSGSLVF